uniref:Uncharacterized protein n=1 Tax=Glossina morsitans morsitans TaxID=37546 RepID=A0ABK9NFY8_GLOMM
MEKEIENERRHSEANIICFLVLYMALYLVLYMYMCIHTNICMGIYVVYMYDSIYIICPCAHTTHDTTLIHLVIWLFLFIK